MGILNVTRDSFSDGGAFIDRERALDHARRMVADVAPEVGGFLAARARACETAGVARDRIVLDPGFGFGKTKEHNLALLRALPGFTELGYPILVGLSRKSMLKELTRRSVHERLAASLAAALAAVALGASIVRVHDVRETVDALDVWHAVAAAAANQDRG